jgi:nucleoside-diphosphate-sugar epimerase
MRALVIGGTRFFGVHLVEDLLKRGFEVTIATRGKTPDPFGSRVHRIIVDRSNFAEFKDRFENEKWDYVFDQIGYSSQDAQEAIEAFRDKTSKYVFTSSKSVYSMENVEGGFGEDDFNPTELEIIMGSAKDFRYDEGKRQAEAVFFQNSPFPVVAVRFPIVLGINDYTQRLNFHIEKVMNHEEIHLSNLDACMDFISEEEAGKFLAWIALSDYTGPINACSDGKVRLGDLIAVIEEKTLSTAKITSISDETNGSPFNTPESWLISNARAKKLGFPFSNVNEWLPVLIKDALEKMKSLN